MADWWKSKRAQIYSPTDRLIAIAVDEVAARQVAELLNVGLATRRKEDETRDELL